MSALTLVLFNLLLNAVPAFAFAATLSWATVRYLRIPPGRAQTTLAALPFAKLAFDLARGVPDSAFLWQRAQGVPRELGSFQIGLGLRWIFLRIDLALGALAGERHYSESAADLLAALLSHKVGAWAPLVIVSALLLVAAALLVQRVAEWLRAARFARQLRAAGMPAEKLRIGRRQIAVYLTDSPIGSPFCGGLVESYICFPRSLWSSLSDRERAAAIAHELGHLAERHLPLIHVVGVLEDLFWFLPGMSHATRRLRAALELSADEWAIDQGHCPLELASALVHVAQSIHAVPSALSRSTCGAARESLNPRISKLLGEPSPPPRWGCKRPLARGLISLWIVGTVLLAVTFGNH